MNEALLRQLYSNYRDKVSLPRRLYIRLRLELVPIDEYLKHLPANGRVLSLGCGYGLAEHYFAIDSPARHILGIDNDRAKIEAAKSASNSLGNVDYRCLDAGDIDTLDAGAWDAVIANDLFHHIDYGTQESIIGEVGRLLKKGGLFLIKDVDPAPGFRRFCNTFHDMVFNKAPRLFYRTIDGYRDSLSGKSIRVESIKYFMTFVFSNIFIVSRKD